MYTANDFILRNDSTLIAFESGATSDIQCIEILIVNDTILESSEFFNIALTSSDPDVDIVDGVTSVIIVDDDGVFVLHVLVYSINEALIQS